MFVSFHSCLFFLKKAQLIITLLVGLEFRVRLVAVLPVYPFIALELPPKKGLIEKQT